MNNFNEAPGAVLCVVTKDANYSCDRAVGDRLQSPCPQSYDCDFRHVGLPSDDVFGFVIVDPALIYRHLVDAVVVTRKRMDDEDAAVQQMDSVLRDVAAKIAKPTRGEAQRRSRPFPVMALDDCDPPCTLRQSRVLIRIDKPRG
jgi:hypothetical protein